MTDDRPSPYPYAAFECDHSTRARDNLSGFASAETTCTACGQAFDADEERELRARDRAVRTGRSASEPKEYVVG